MLFLRLEVHGPSMEPAFPAGRRLWANRLAYLFGAPQRGDVIVFRSVDDPARCGLKRIIGLPHETVVWQAGNFWVNGVALKEPYARIAHPSPGDDERHTLHLGAQDYVVAGDNRLYSRDSRRYGPIPRSAILGRILS